MLRAHRNTYMTSSPPVCALGSPHTDVTASAVVDDGGDLFTEIATQAHLATYRGVPSIVYHPLVTELGKPVYFLPIREVKALKGVVICQKRERPDLPPQRRIAEVTLLCETSEECLPILRSSTKGPF